jgi:heme-degrading monooxygenase HmoA
VHAILREATYATDTPVHESREFKEFQALHARQPGFAGSYVIDAGDGRLFTVTLWESSTHAAAARAVLEPGRAPGAASADERAVPAAGHGSRRDS